jgi:hypothetical protein
LASPECQQAAAVKVVALKVVAVKVVAVKVVAVKVAAPMGPVEVWVDPVEVWVGPVEVWVDRQVVRDCREPRNVGNSTEVDIMAEATTVEGSSRAIVICSHLHSGILE